MFAHSLSSEPASPAFAGCGWWRPACWWRWPSSSCSPAPSIISIRRSAMSAPSPRRPWSAASADWFAVTALFRHPLHLPIPHTAIIPRNKDRIASTLAQFLRDNFLTPKVVARRMQRLDFAGAAGRWAGQSGARRRPDRRAAPAGLPPISSNRSTRSAWAAWPRARSPRGLRAIDVAPLFGQDARRGHCQWPPSAPARRK